MLIQPVCRYESSIYSMSIQFSRKWLDVKCNESKIFRLNCCVFISIISSNSILFRWRMHFLDAFYSTNVKRILPMTWTLHLTMKRLIPIGWPCSVPTIRRKGEIRSSLQILHRPKALELTLLVAVTRDRKQVRGRWRWHRWLPIETLLLCSPWRPVLLVTASLYQDMKMIQIKIITSVNIEQLFNFFFLNSSNLL